MSVAMKEVVRRAWGVRSHFLKGAVALALAGLLTSSTPAQSGGGGASSAAAPPAARTSAATTSSGDDAARLRQETFDVVWRTVSETHFDPTFGGVDWNKVRAEYAPRAAEAKSDGEFYGVLRQMVGELRLSHFVIYPPGAFDAATPGSPAGGDVGIDLRVIEGEAVVVRLRPGAAAARGGAIRPGFRIVKIDDAPLRP